MQTVIEVTLSLSQIHYAQLGEFFFLDGRGHIGDHRIVSSYATVSLICNRCFSFYSRRNGTWSGRILVLFRERERERELIA